jgi:hypothetical protein
MVWRIFGGVLFAGLLAALTIRYFEHRDCSMALG